MKPYSIFAIPEDARRDFEEFAKKNNLNVPPDDGSVLVIGRTDDGEELMKFPDQETAEGAAELANMAFEWGRRYQSTHPNEPWDSEYREVVLFSKEATDSAARAVLGDQE